MVVNAAGPWAASLLADLPADAQGAPPPRLSRAMNVIVRKVVNDHACGGLANGRFLFMVPWRDVSMLGTSHDAHEGTADQLKVIALGSRGVPEGCARGVSARRPDRERRPAGASRPAADGSGKARTSSW